MKTFEIIHRPTGKEYEVAAESYAKACETLGLRPKDCHLVWASYKAEQ